MNCRVLCCVKFAGLFNLSIDVVNLGAESRDGSTALPGDPPSLTGYLSELGVELGRELGGATNLGVSPLSGDVLRVNFKALIHVLEAAEREEVAMGDLESLGEGFGE